MRLDKNVRLRIFKEIHKFLFSSVNILAVIAIVCGLAAFATHAYGYILGK